MKNEEIFAAAINKASESNHTIKALFDKHIPDMVELASFMIREEKHYAVIFSHSFAKAFWHGVDWSREMNVQENWRYHLAEMVLCEDPIKYLAKFI